MKSYINRIKKGDFHALTYENPLALALTSGTTSEPKLIPITPSSNINESKGAMVWNLLLRQKHGEKLGKILILSGGPKEFSEEFMKL